MLRRSTIAAMRKLFKRPDPRRKCGAFENNLNRTTEGVFDEDRIRKRLSYIVT
jgi:hypothetical protein